MAYSGMNGVNPMAVPVQMQRGSIVSASGTTLPRRRGSILLGDEREVPQHVNNSLMSPIPSSLPVMGQGAGFISPQQLYMTQLQAQIAQQQVQQQNAFLLQMAMQSQSQNQNQNQTQSVPTGSTTSQQTKPATVKRARSSFVISTGSPQGVGSEDDEKTADDLRLHKSSFEWVQTPELWRGGRVDVHGNTVTVQGSVCVVSNVKIAASEHGQVVEWAVYIEKIPNRCWIGIVPGTLLEIGGRWKIGECPPTQGIGVENTYGMIYKGQSKVGVSLLRAPKNRDLLRFKMDFAAQTLFGSLNDESGFKVWYKGPDLPERACIAIVNSTGRGKFQLRSAGTMNSK